MQRVEKILLDISGKNLFDYHKNPRVKAMIIKHSKHSLGPKIVQLLNWRDEEGISELDIAECDDQEGMETDDDEEEMEIDDDEEGMEIDDVNEESSEDDLIVDKSNKKNKKKKIHTKHLKSRECVLPLNAKKVERSGFLKLVNKKK